MTLTLATLRYQAFSPSLFQYHSGAHTVQIAYNGQGWVIGIDGVYGRRSWKTRHEAALLIQEAFYNALNQGS